jgi:hypothetical protein
VLIHSDENVEAVFVFGPERVAEDPCLFMDVALVLHFSPATFRFTAESCRYENGLVLKPRFGPHAGHTLTLIAQYPGPRSTDGGGLAPKLREADTDAEQAAG